MKKIIPILLCLVLLLAGCEQLQKAEPYYTETRDGITFKTQYEYYFEDESNILCSWINESGDSLNFHDVFELHILGDDGEWYLVTKGDEVTFNTNYRHGIDPESETTSRYELSLYTKGLKNGETYRISTYFFDDNGKYYQVFAEFTCNNSLAENEIKSVTDGAFNDRSDPEDGKSFEIITGGNG